MKLEDEDCTPVDGVAVVDSRLCNGEITTGDNSLHDWPSWERAVDRSPARLPHDAFSRLRKLDDRVLVELRVEEIYITFGDRLEQLLYRLPVVRVSYAAALLSRYG